MKIIHLEQGSPQWLSWRRTVITATDASILMGNNPWTTPYVLWQRKLGLIEDQQSNEAMERGKRLEPEARELFMKENDILMEPQVVESTEFEFLGASLDGITPSGGCLLEIKCGGSKLHDMAARGEIPAYYQDQMQHQLLVTGAEKCFYYSYNGTNGICIEVLPDPAWKEAFLPKARAFLRCVAFCEPPPLQDGDYKDMSGDIKWKLLAEGYREMCDRIELLEESKASYRKEILALCGDQSCSGQGIKVMKTTVRGRVDYDAIPELQGLDLSKYRKPPATTWKIFVS